MIKATLSGNESLDTGTSQIDARVIDLIGGRPVAVELRSKGERCWTVRLDCVSPDHTADGLDYCASYWRNADLLVITGPSSFATVSAKDGKVISRGIVRSINRRSVDRLGILMGNQTTATALIVATKSLVCVELSGQVRWSWEVPGLVTDVGSVSGGVAEIEIYDGVTPPVSRRKVHVDLRSGILIDGVNTKG